MGECTVGNTIKFREKYGESPCTVGGYYETVQDMEYLEEFKDKLESIEKQYRKDEEERWKR